MPKTGLCRIKAIAEFHQFRGLPKPEHPLISVVDVALLKQLYEFEPTSLVFDFYSIALKRNFNGKMKYGQQEYDFDGGLMTFMSPGQVFSIDAGKDGTGTRLQSGLLLLIHPDFLWNTALAKTIRQYEYFDYSVNEALFLSEKEETIIAGIMHSVQQEYHANLDQFSQSIIIAHLELLLSYADRFYHRQFITRKITNHKLLDRLEHLLFDYFNSDALVTKGLPTVQSISDALNVSPNYLSTLLKLLTGQSTQQHIHNKLIEKAKEKLSTTDLSVSEIAFTLGFEHSQSFSKLFKNKTALSPLEFRQSFN
ncbi:MULTISPECIES: helix-turn-helix transcriptional regulator [unclassified Spirosoma]|mgnify:CR=1 FL=1|uniref:helix-turn-helix domain-containing protein n=1 Tax=unclassified Spirosoma TaxID=2621999 RepID=UPI000965B1A2|nr:MULTISPECIES: helix-turn-helix transcriptional regulator [unclassified Spirosoma]MBN8823926.1 helix-turn-helix transcriptional regulator [Spirosoma sp.]OJW79683.1 MAG: AraC family transcriptional regulator [Spirosoma sp. 48-14]